MLKIYLSKFNLKPLFKKITIMYLIHLIEISNYYIILIYKNAIFILSSYQSMLDKVAVVIDRFDLSILKVPVRGVFKVIELRYILVNSSVDKSENSVIP